MRIELTHDGSFDIATGRHRKETAWKNKEMSWSDLLARLSKTHYTAETHGEYMAAKKSRQDEIKDIGGFVGGHLNKGRRLIGNVLHRQLVTLDVDFCKQNIWDDFTLMYGNAGAIYSTHKHSPTSPRLRLIIPLDRPVFSDEYEAIARKIAGILDVENFDPTTFEVNRLMYWPSTPKDGEYVFEYQDGPWLSADEILNGYRDWRDSSEWPISVRCQNIVHRAIKKQGDPLEKPGVIGAWCRTFTIAEAIETFLADVYEPCDIEGRYTYKEGSTAAGLITYDDKYAYSHHGTDPTGGKLCNAFDLVRLHKYGLQDEDVRDDTPGNRLPSYNSMIEFATKEPKVRKQLGAERLHEAKGDFANIDTEEAEEVNNDWLEKLEVDRKGNYHSTINNILTIINNDPALKGRLSKNLFEKREITLKSLPWRELKGGGDEYLVDADDAGMRHYLENTYNIGGGQKIKDAMDISMIKNSFHPVRDYLKTCLWDGVKRLDTLLIDYLGAEDSEYTRAVTRKTFVAGVARIFNPGVKYDYVLTLVGPQGRGKSTIIKKLGREWYSDSFGTIQGKEAYEQLQGVWLVEIGELAGLKKAEIEAIKHFISKQEDRYRVAYGKRLDNFPRQCIFIATTNNRDFLRDPTGNRRFWPVDVGMHEPTKSVFTDLDDTEVAQIWAEAMHLYRNKETLFLSKELEAEAYKAQKEHSEQDERAGLIHKYLDTLLPANWQDLDIYQRRAFLQGDELSEEGTITRNKVCIAEIWCEVLNGQQKDMTTNNTKDIHNIMRTLDGWDVSSKKVKTRLYGVQRGYSRIKKAVATNAKS